MKLLLLISISLPLVLWSCTQSAPDVETDVAAVEVIDLNLKYDLGISFPPVADEEQLKFTKPLLKELKVQKIRIGEDWGFRESEEGLFNWFSLDRRISWALGNDFQVLLTIQSNGADWACSAERNQNSCVFSDHQKFKNYVEQLLKRYPNQIAKIQFGNEWMSDFWFVGDGASFTKANNIVYDAIQQYSPNTTFVLGGFTAISLRFLAGCDHRIDTFYDDEGNTYNRAYLDANCDSKEIQRVRSKIDFVLENARYDEIDIHLYDDVENWDIYFDYIKGRVQKPIIITEFGGPNVNIEPVSEAYQSERLIQYLQAINKMDVTEAYYFKLVEGTNNPAHAESGLINYPELTKKQSFTTFKRVSKKP